MNPMIQDGPPAVAQLTIVLLADGRLMVQAHGPQNLLVLLGMIEKAKSDLIDSAKAQATGPQIEVAPAGMSVTRNGR